MLAVCRVLETLLDRGGRCRMIHIIVRVNFHCPGRGLITHRPQKEKKKLPCDVSSVEVIYIYIYTVLSCAARLPATPRARETVKEYRWQKQQAGFPSVASGTRKLRKTESQTLNPDLTGFGIYKGQREAAAAGYLITWVG